MHAQHSATHKEFSATLPQEEVQKWQKMVDDWNEDPVNAPDPYEEPRASEFRVYLSVRDTTDSDVAYYVSRDCAINTPPDS